MAQTTLMFYGIRHAARGSVAIGMHFGQFAVVVPRNRWFFFSLQSVAMRYSHTISAINFPGILVDLLMTLVPPWKPLGHPPQLTMDSWRGLSLPIFCLPAWWLVGRGIDVFRGRKQLHWGTLLTGSILFTLFAIVLLGFTFGLSAADRADASWMLWGLALWVLAFGILPLTWLRTRHRGKSESILESNERLVHTALRWWDH